MKTGVKDERKYQNRGEKEELERRECVKGTLFFPADTGMSKFPIVTVKVYLVLSCLILSVVYKILYVYVYLRYTIFFPQNTFWRKCVCSLTTFLPIQDICIPQLNHGEVVEMNGLERKAHDFDTGDRQQL